MYVQHGPDITTGNGTCSLGIQFLPSALLMARQAHQVARAALRAAPGALPHRVIGVLVHRLAPVGCGAEQAGVIVPFRAVLLVGVDDCHVVGILPPPKVRCARARVNSYFSLYLSWPATLGIDLA